MRRSASALLLPLVAGGCVLLTDLDELRTDVPSAIDNTTQPDGAVGVGDDGGGGTAEGGTEVDSNTPIVVPDDAGNGTGQLGSLSVATAGMVVNKYTGVTTNAAAGDSKITVDDASPFATGAALLVWQTTGLTSATSGDAANVNLTQSPVGRFEIARVASKAGNTLTLTGSLASAFPAKVSQVVSVPEYQDVTVQANASIRAAPWNGTTGGIVVMLIANQLKNDGAIASDAAGFRGGRGFTRVGGSLTTCPGNDGTPVDGHAAKGEGLWVAGFTAAAGASVVGGRGNFANGAGGGNCHNSGGGGGGHGGVGGKGGRSGTFTNEDLVGGMSGAALTYDPFLRLAFGGGGGSGDSDTQIGNPAVNGGAGGGVVFIRAKSMIGSGTISANGASADPILGNGGGGGGAGGLVVIDITEAAACGGLHANGGNGSKIDANKAGTTGGGGGGRVLLRATQPSAASCISTTGGGTAGVQNDATALDGLAHGATDGAQGVAQFIAH